MENYLNATCKVCGKLYHRCVSCEKIPGSWRLVACSPECWNVWVDQINARNRQEEVAVSITEKTEETSVETGEPTETTSYAQDLSDEISASVPDDTLNNTENEG